MQRERTEFADLLRDGWTLVLQPNYRTVGGRTDFGTLAVRVGTGTVGPCTLR
ncbi:hypothetical protein [Micromonospora sp. NPDC050200]|uniref:hypothetical protein n=1 Tax=Micromonospora sp. NPDC050200 TaxID=3155664 RepID=UPI0033F274C8